MNCLRLFVLFSLLSSIAHSQLQAYELNPVTITASLHPVPAARTGRNIVTIPGQYFSKLAVHSIDELLKYVPGVEVQMRGPQGSQSDIVIRGGTFQQVLVILDGIRLNDPNTGHFNSYIPIAPSEIERIEVLKGASSAIYGTEAVGGVINIITKTFSAKKERKQNDITGKIALGEYGLFNAVAGVNFQRKSTAFGVGLSTNNSNGQLQRGTRGSFNNLTTSVSFRHFFNDNWSVAVRSSFEQRKFGAQNFYTTFLSDTANERVSGFWNHANIQYNNGRHRLSLHSGFKNIQDEYQFNPSSTANNNKSGLLQFLLTDHFQVKTNAMITAGVQFQQKSIRSNDRGNHSLSQIAGFMVLNHELGNFSYNPSFRIDHSERRGVELVPQLNLSLHLSKWQLRASAGKTIRDADFTERFNNYAKAFVAGGSVGNADLTAERSFSYEVGADYFAGKSLKISTSLFQRLQTDLIDWITTPYSDMPRKENLSPTGTFALARNIADVNTSGIELDVQYSKEFTPGHSAIAMIGFTWLDNVTQNSQPSFYLSSHAKFLTNFSLVYTTGRFAISVNGVYKNRASQHTPSINAKLTRDYFLLNSRASVSISKRRAGLYLQVDNISDLSYSDLLGSKMPGRWISGGITFEFE